MAKKIVPRDSGAELARLLGITDRRVRKKYLPESLKEITFSPRLSLNTMPINTKLMNPLT